MSILRPRYYSFVCLVIRHLFILSYIETRGCSISATYHFWVFFESIHCAYGVFSKASLFPRVVTAALVSTCGLFIQVGCLLCVVVGTAMLGIQYKQFVRYEIEVFYPPFSCSSSLLINSLFCAWLRGDFVIGVLSNRFFYLVYCAHISKCACHTFNLSKLVLPINMLSCVSNVRLSHSQSFKKFKKTILLDNYI